MKTILRSADFNTCLICRIEEKRSKKDTRRWMYQMTTITDYIPHSIISLNKKKEREDSYTSSLYRTRLCIIIVL